MLAVTGLTVRFRTRHGLVQALSGVDLRVHRGQILTVVGESGSGKTVLAHALMGLLPRNAEVTGSVRLWDRELVGLPESALERVRARHMALIPQGAASALNPVRRVGSLLLELLQARGLARAAARRALAAAFAALDLDFDLLAGQYPHQLSGGMQQRVLLALALAAQADLVIADEPTFGLDSDLVEATARQLLYLAERGSALVVITHDLRLAQRLGGEVAVLYASYLVERRPSVAFFAAPAHPYSQGLLGALPERGGVPIPGMPPELSALPPGCPFWPRCTVREPACQRVVPPLASLPAGGAVRCVLHAEG